MRPVEIAEADVNDPWAYGFQVETRILDLQ